MEYNTTIENLCLIIANSACWHGHVLRKEDGHVLRRALDGDVNDKTKRTWKVEERSMKVGFTMEHTCF